MRTYRIIVALAVLSAPLAAGYVVEWSTTVSSYSYSSVYTANKEFSMDITGDSIPDVLVYDSAALRIYSGVTHNLVWTIPTGAYNYAYQSGVGNTDGDPNKELIVLAYRLNGSVYQGRFYVYDCQTHGQEFASPEKTGYLSCAMADIDGDDKGEICLLSGTGSRLLEVYGSTDVGVDDAQLAPDASHPIVAAFPNPARGYAQFDIPAPAAGREVRITDIAGRLLRTIPLPAGDGVIPVTWDCRNADGQPVPAGTYLYQCGGRTGKLEVMY
jgi:hypothetical protein